jgi:hypothetical protein
VCARQCGKKSSFFVIKAGNAQLDFVAFGITLVRRAPPARRPPARVFVGLRNCASMSRVPSGTWGLPARLRQRRHLLDRTSDGRRRRAAPRLTLRRAPRAQLITAIVAYGARESATINLIFKGANICLIVLILCLSYPHANKQNWADFWHFGDVGIFAAASTVFFAYNGARALARPHLSRARRTALTRAGERDVVMPSSWRLAVAHAGKRGAQGITPRATWRKRWAAHPPLPALCSADNCHCSARRRMAGRLCRGRRHRAAAAPGCGSRAAHPARAARRRATPSATCPSPSSARSRWRPSCTCWCGAPLDIG